jgi:CRP-like cAMP-binding protein
MFLVIQESDLFQGLSQHIISKIADNMTEESCDEGGFIIKEGDPADYLFILHEGKVRLSVGERGQITHMIADPGEIFGWSSIVDRGTYTASAECLEFTKLMRIHKDKLTKIFTDDPTSGLIFYKRLAGVIGDRLSNSYKTLLSMHRRQEPASYG